MLEICSLLRILGMAMFGMDLTGIMLAKYKAPLERLALKVPLELLAQLALKVPKALPGLKAPLELMDLTASPDPLDQLALKGPRALPARLGKLAQLDQLGQRALLEIRD